MRINREIRAPKVRVISEEGEMLGVFTPFEALKLAEERGLDLIEIAPNAAPPTCRIMDYGKWKYENKKKAATARKKQTVVSIKELQMRPRTDQHDLEVKLRHAKRFLIDGDKVKFKLRFMGREMAHQELGLELLKKVVESLSYLAIVETSPKMEGRNMFCQLAPDPIKIKAVLKDDPNHGKSSGKHDDELEDDLNDEDDETRREEEE